MTTADRLDELPDDLADRAAERLLAASGAARGATLAALIEEHPDRAAALRALCADLEGVEQILDAGYPDAAPAQPTHIGGCRVLRSLGEGAFGIVYLCAQERPVVRQVAIKVLRPGAGDPKTLQRFAAERQLLAQLNHPGITHVFDAGELADGRPFFVMEYVDGAPITAWCATRQLPHAQRLRLFTDVCRAVAHAHARGIVHRDLKPANVLVVTTPDGPAPKVIDFGIAKAVSGGDEDREPRTEAGRVIGTPGYMSPEQAAGRTDRIDARADVFSLGVILYELLTDQLPWSRSETAGDTEPLRPSARVRAGKATTGTSPRHRLAAELQGDLDWITLKALARERDERYASVAELAADVERHLRGETVSVGPPSLRYRLRKFARRNRAAVVAAVACAAVVVVLVAVFAELTRRSANTAFADQRAFVATLLQRANDPALFGTPHGDEVRRTYSADALAMTEKLLAMRADDPSLLHDRCEALQSIAELQFLLGESTRSRAVAAQAVEIARGLSADAPDDPRRRGLLGSALRHEGRALALAGDFPTASERHTEAIGHLEAAAAADPARWQRLFAVTLTDAAAVLGSQRQVSIPLFERSIALFDGMHADPAQRAASRADMVSAMLGLAWHLTAERRFDDAWTLVERAGGELAGLDRTSQRATCDWHRLRAKVAWQRGARESTLADYRAAAEVAERWCGEQPRRVAAHRFLVGTLDDLGYAANYVGDFAASDAAYRRAIAAAEAMTVQFPADSVARCSLVGRLCTFAYSLRDRFRLQALPEARQLIALAFEHDAVLGDAKVETRLPRWLLLTFRAGVEESLGDPAAPASWREVEDVVPTGTVDGDFQRGHRIEAFTRIAHWRLCGGEPGVAAQWLARARSEIRANPQHVKRLVEVGWLEASIAFRQKDVAAIVATADEIAKARPTWFGYRRAADCLRLAALGSTDRDDAAAYQERAREFWSMVVGELDADVGKSPGDPWFAIPWGVAKVRLAELAALDGDDDGARGLVDAGLARLDAARPDAQHDMWDDDAYRAGQELQQRLRR